MSNKSNPVSLLPHHVCPQILLIFCVFLNTTSKKFELDQINVDGYRHDAAYCRQVVKRGGVCIFVQKNLEYTNTDLDKYCNDQDIEVCVLKLKSTFFNACIMTVYRAPTGNFNLFLNRLDDIIKTLYKVDLKLIICGDINIDYLTDNDKKRHLDAVLLTYNLSAIVHFPTRSQGYFSTAIDNIFSDTYKFINYTVSPLHNGLSDHDAQLLIINDVNPQLQNHHIYTIRNINYYSIEEFKTRLSYESWESVFGYNGNKEVDILFNLFLNNYLRIFYISFSPRKITERSNNNSWITPGIRIYCRSKRCLYLLTRDSDDVILKNYYKQYCKTLTTVIKEAKKYMYSNRIINSTNKMKAMWNIIKSETNRLKEPTNTTINSCQNSPEAFNKYFLSITENIIHDIRCRNKKGYNINKNPNYYLLNLFHKPFPNIKFKNTSTKEIERIINSLKIKESSEYDEISTKILKTSAPFISSPLRYICNKSTLSGNFPTRLKYAIVKPLLKKGDKENIANYRPISSLTSFAKVLEKIIYDRLLKHIETNNILAVEQFGFRTPSSTEKASYKLINDTLNALNNRMTVGGIICDLQKAFVCVNHNILPSFME